MDHSGKHLSFRVAAGEWVGKRDKAGALSRGCMQTTALRMHWSLRAVGLSGSISKQRKDFAKFYCLCKVIMTTTVSIIYLVLSHSSNHSTGLIHLILSIGSSLTYSIQYTDEETIAQRGW